MYWYKVVSLKVIPNHSGRLPHSRSAINTAGAVILLLLLMGYLSSCKPDIRETGAVLKYFDLKGYFRADSARLSRMHPRVLKTVKHNGNGQTQKVTIDNWGEELAMFTASDINKPAWRGSYHISTTLNTTVYTATDPKLTTRRIIIDRDSSTQKVKWILIFNQTHNLLYTSGEKLTYFPDSLYQIEKKQVIRLIGTNYYTVKGQINQ